MARSSWERRGCPHGPAAGETALALAGRPGRSGKTEAADPLVGRGTFPVCSPRAPQSSACGGGCCGHTGSAQKTPTSSEQLLTAPHWPDPISRVLPGLTAPRDPSTHAGSPGPRPVQGVPSSTSPRPCPEARLPALTHLPLGVPSPPGWEKSSVSGTQLGSDPWRVPASTSGINKVFFPWGWVPCLCA